MESKDVAVLGAVAGVVVLVVVFGKTVTDALKKLFDTVAPPSGGTESGPPVPTRGAPDGITGRILDFNRTAGGWQAQVEVTNGSTKDATIALQFYAEQHWNLGAGADEIIDLTKTVNVPASSSVPVTFTDQDLAFSLFSSWSAKLFANGTLLASED